MSVEPEIATSSSDRSARRLMSVLRGRLVQSRWILAAAAVAVLLVAVRGQVGLGWAALAFALVAGVAAVAPRRTRRSERAVSERQETPVTVERLSAVSLAAAVPDPLILFDRDGIIHHANAPAEKSFRALPGLDVRLRFRAPEMQELLRATLADEDVPEPVEYSERVPIERLYRVSATAVGEEAGLYALVFKDQSEARRIDRMRADFIANASHELRTPLASITGFIETLRGPAKDDPAARERFLGIMHNQTLRMARLIDDLLSLSRIEMKPFARPGEKVELRLIVGSVLDSLNQLAAESGVRFERHFPDSPVEVPGIRDELFQVFENLVENACKYGQSGGRVEVSIATSDGSGRPEAEVMVRDFGPGIAEEHIPRVTERFYRVDVENSRAQKGTGLGLSIVKHILTRHNGRLTISSEVGKGASFTVHLPMG